MKSLELQVKPIFKELHRLPFGSQIYTHSPNDYDYIILIPDNTGSFVYRYKDGDQDYTYVGINQFFEGLIKGSNPEFFEALHTNDGIAFLLHELRIGGPEFYYNRYTVNSFLGIAKRDLDYPDRTFFVIKNIIIADIIMSEKILEPSKLYGMIEEYKNLNFDKNKLLGIINDMKRESSKL